MYNVDKTMKAIQLKMSSKKTLSLELKNGVTVLIADYSTAEEYGWCLYIGCELVVADTTLDRVAYAVCDIASKSKMSLMSEFGYGAVVEEDPVEYGSSNPWDAPGMRVSDFIHGVSIF